MDLAVQSLHDYLQHLAYNRNFVECWELKSTLANLMLAQVLKSESALVS
jgi:hypothetical protein